MTNHTIIVFIIFGAMSFLFIQGKVRHDLTALLGLLALVFTEILKPEEAFVGFSSPTMIIMISTFFIGEAFFDTGVADKIGKWILKLCGGRERPSIFLITAVTASIATFIGTIATTIIMMPVAAYLSRRGGISPSRLFIPISFGSVMGGTATMLGTRANMIASDILTANKISSFSLFSFTPVGLSIIICGLAFITFWAPKALAVRVQNTNSRDDNISEIYGLRDRLFSITIPYGSPLAHQKISSLQFSSVLNIAVVAIIRGSHRIHIPSGEEIVRENDILVVRGKIDHLRRILRFNNIRFSKVTPAILGNITSNWGLIRIDIDQRSLWSGKRIDSLPCESLQIAIIAFKHRSKISAVDVNRHYLEPGDSLYAFVNLTETDLRSLSQDFIVTTEKMKSTDEVLPYLYQFNFSELKDSLNDGDNDSSYLSVSLIHPLFVIRDGFIKLIDAKTNNFLPTDKIVVSCEIERLSRLPKQQDFETSKEVPNILSDDESTGLLEVAITPRSELVGHNIIDVHFREKYGVQVIAILREGKPIRTGFGELTLKIGDNLLLFGPPKKFIPILKDPDFVVLSDFDKYPIRTHRSVNLLSALLFFVYLISLGTVPFHISALATAVFLVLTKAVSIEQVYRKLDMRLVVIVGGLLPMGIAFDKSGAALFVSDFLLSLTGHENPYLILAILVLAASSISQMFDSGLAVVLIAPVAIKAALATGLNPHALVMAISLGSSIAFLSPASHRAHLLVMGAGGYKKRDYFLLGAPLSIITFVIVLFAVPYFIGF